MDDELRQVLEAIRQENVTAHAETRRHFDVVGETSGTNCGLSRKASDC